MLLNNLLYIYASLPIQLAPQLHQSKDFRSLGLRNEKKVCILFSLPLEDSVR